MTPEKKTELLELASAYIEGQLDEATKARLQEMLLDDEDCRRIFADFLHDHASLFWRNVSQDAEGELDREFFEKLPAPESPRPRIHLGLAVGAMALMAIAAIALLLQLASPQSDEDQGIARITRLVGDATNGAGNSLVAGDALPAEAVLEMQTGLIELVFDGTDVHAIASAPLTMELVNHSLIRLDQGEVRLHVPPQGIGFVVETPERQITDLGTSFVVTTQDGESKVLVLDGKVSIAEPVGNTRHLMTAGDFARFEKDGQVTFQQDRPEYVPEISHFPAPAGGLRGSIYTLDGLSGLPDKNKDHKDWSGRQVLPLVRSGFQDRSCLDEMRLGPTVSFAGIAGAYSHFTRNAGLKNDRDSFGWVACYQGKVFAPVAGRYRFWGYADNHLVVAVDGKPVFNGSRFGSILSKEAQIPRQNHPSLPCLNGVAGFASGAWFEAGEGGVELDILFGEVGYYHTQGLLLLEREGTSPDETFWGQPKLPLFLTSPPSPEQTNELLQLSDYLEERVMGAFTVDPAAVWRSEG